MDDVAIGVEVIVTTLIYNTSFELDKLNLVYLAFETSEDETIDRIQALKS
ncbi:hypothetical protein ACEN33_01935 [Ruoffia sp. FAM 24228]